MNKVVHINDYKRVDTRSSPLQCEIELRERNRKNLGIWQQRVRQSVANQSEAFRGGFGHRGPGGDAA